MSKVRSDNISNRADDGAPALVYGAEVPVGYGITGAGGISITGIVTATGGSFSGDVSVGGVLTYADVTNVDSIGIITARSDVSIADKIIHTGDTDTAIRFPAADTFTVETAGSEAIRIDSSGRLLLGTTTEGEASADDLTIATSGSTGITIRSGTSNSGNLFFSDGTSGNDEIRGYVQYLHASNDLLLGTNASEALRIDSSQQLLLGTTSSYAVGSSAASSLQISGSLGFQSLSRFAANSAGPNLILGKSRNASPGSSTVVQDDDDLGNITFAGDDGTDLQSVAARIVCEVDGTPGSNDMPGRLTFHTTSDGAASPTERLRIDSSGNIGAGGITNPSFTTGGGIHLGDDYGIGFGVGASGRPDFQIASVDGSTLDFRCGFGGDTADISITTGGNLGINHSTPQFGITLGQTASDIGKIGWEDAGNSKRASITCSTSTDALQFHTGTSDTERMRIDSSGRLFLYNITGNAASGSTLKYSASDDEVRYDTSSRLLKTNITECTYGIETIKKLKPSRYTPQEYDTDGNINVTDEILIGFIADEMVEEVPEVVQMYPKSTLTKNVEDTEIVPAAISYDKLTAVLTKALQEAIAKIETLETQNASLEARLTTLEG